MKTRKFGLLATITSLFVSVFAFALRDNHPLQKAEAGATAIEGTYFVDEYDGDTLDTAFSTVYDRGVPDNTAAISAGECVASLNNGHFGTTNNYSTFVSKFKVYNATEARVQFMIGDTQPANNHNAGGGTNANSYAFVVTNTFIRVFTNGAQLTEKSFTTGVNTTTYSHFVICATATRIEIKIDDKLLYSRAIATPLVAGPIIFSKPNALPVYHFDSLSVEPLDYSFNETFDDGRDENMSFYNRHVATRTIAGGTSTVVLNNDNYATTGYYQNFTLTTVMKNTAQARIAITIGGATLPETTGYAAYNNMSSGMFRVIILPTLVRWLEGNSTVHEVVGRQGLPRIIIRRLNSRSII